MAGSVAILSMTEIGGKEGRWKGNVPHILKARRFGIETVIITARSDAAAAG